MKRAEPKRIARHELSKHHREVLAAQAEFELEKQRFLALLGDYSVDHPSIVARETRAARASVCRSLLLSDISLTKLEYNTHLRLLLDQGSDTHLGTRRQLADSIGLVQFDESRRVTKEVQQLPVALYVDGTSRFCSSGSNRICCEAFIVRFASWAQWQVEERLVALDFFESAGLQGDQLGTRMRQLAREYEFDIVFVGADCAGENYTATWDHLAPYSTAFGGCLSHLCNNSRGKLPTKALDSVFSLWNKMMISHSDAVERWHQLCKRHDLNHRSFVTNQTRWYSEFEAQSKWNDSLDLVVDFLQSLKAAKRCKETVTKLLKHFTGNFREQPWYLELQTVLLAFRPVVQACYQLEARGLIAPFVWDIMERAVEHVSKCSVDNKALEAVYAYLRSKLDDDKRYNCAYKIFRASRFLRWDVVATSTVEEVSEHLSALHVLLALKDPPRSDEVPNFVQQASSDKPSPIDWSNLTKETKRLSLVWENQRIRFPYLSRLILHCGLYQPTVTTCDRTFSSAQKKWQESQATAYHDLLSSKIILGFNDQQRNLPCVHSIGFTRSTTEFGA